MAGQKGNTNKPIDKEARNINITIRLSEKEIERITEFSSSLNVPRSRLMRSLILFGLDNISFLRDIDDSHILKTYSDFEKCFNDFYKVK